MKIVIIGSQGNVGKGIYKAFEKHHEVVGIDPQINKKFEDFSDNELEDLLKDAKHIVYSADCGNRDEYEKSSSLADENNARFTYFCKTVAEIDSNINIWYIGGSWTKRKPVDFIVHDDSANKDLEECNAYEKAKIFSEENSRRLSKGLNLKIRFIDYISIVPNLAENFSICKMVKEAVESKVIHYSSGDYGRPLLDNITAGEVLLKMINEDDNESFKTLLIPGVFIRFEDFAITVQKVVEQKLGTQIKLIKQESTPDFLKTKIESKYSKGLDQSKVLSALEQNAILYLGKINKEV